MSFSLRAKNENSNSFEDKATHIAKLLFEEFSGDVLLFFKNHHLDYYDKSPGDPFVSTPTLPQALKNIYRKKHIELNFYCKSLNVQTTSQKEVFFKNLTPARKNCTFFLSPYFEHEGKTHAQESAEDFYSCEFKYHFQIKIYKDKLNFQVISQENERATHKIAAQIKEIIKTKSLQNKDLYSKEILCKKLEAMRKKIHLPREFIINSINSLKSHMNQGDCYLANMTHTASLSPSDFLTQSDFIALWFRKKTRYGVYFQREKQALACFSPERFVLCKKNMLVCEPIKGTQSCLKKKATLQDAKRLGRNKKEIYEHTLIADLMRNDLNQFCVPGSVQVYRPFRACVAGALLQMQSAILGQKETAVSAGDVFAYLLPAGSVTGTPKKKVCELISRSEQSTRGYYTGVCGVLEPSGEFDSCVLIRSLYRGKKGVYLGVGAGITTLSHAPLEMDEFEAKLDSFLMI